MRTFLPVLALAFVIAPCGFSQSADVWFCAGESLLSNNVIGDASIFGASNGDVKETNGFRFGFRLDINWHRFLGHEIGYAYSRTQFRLESAGQTQDMGTAIHTFGYNMLVYATPEGSRIRPYGTGGVHFSSFAFPGMSAAYGGASTKFGFNYGVGVKFRVTSMWGFRLDLRQYQTGKPFDLPGATSGLLRQTEVSAGVGVMF